MNSYQTRLYYTAPNIMQHTAKVVAIEGNAVLLDTTIFHPQGGGTHVESFSAIGAIFIRNIKNKGGKIRIGYDVVEPLSA